MGTSEQPPIREILSELTFEINDEGLDPFDAYVREKEMFKERELNPHDYCGSSITSGGHARNNSLAIHEIVMKNTETAFRITDELFKSGQLHLDNAIEAVALGKLNWKQSEYMEFWLANMAGLRSEGAGINQHLVDFRKKLGRAIRSSDTLDMDVYDSSDSADTRARHYFEHAEAFADVAKEHEAKPVERLIQLVDPGLSLGSQAEKLFAKEMNTSVFRVAIAQTGIEASERNMHPALLHDTENLVRFGATVFDTMKRELLVLTPETTG